MMCSGDHPTDHDVFTVQVTTLLIMMCSGDHPPDHDGEGGGEEERPHRLRTEERPGYLVPPSLVFFLR